MMMMNSTTTILEKTSFFKSRFTTLFAFLLVLIIGTLNVSSQSTKEFKTSTDTLVVYSDIPGHSALVNGINPRIKSDVYEIRVRSAATNNEWVQCFANYTYNRYYELPVPSTNPPNNMAYIRHCGGWSQTYANVEMSNNSTIEVEISKIGSALLDGVSIIEKFAVHPKQKVFDTRMENGKVYFKLNKPCQVVIDINGQMDDHNAGYSEFAQIGRVHAISFFANPVIAKPATSGAGVLYVTAGTKPDMYASYSRMVFGPGVHNIGAGFKIFGQRSYYIPGDAIVYGSLDNSGSTGDGISISGYGTLSGFYTPHYQNLASDNALHYPTYTGGAHVAITINGAKNVKLQGITIIDPANFSGTFPYDSYSKMSWVKAITWRVNGDGCSLGTTTDCFYRTSDDMPSVGGSKLRCTFWKDTNGNINRFRNYTPGTKATLEDCDIIYHRRRPGASGAVWPVQTVDYLKIQKQILVDVTIKNIRFHDKKGDMPIFALNSDGVSFNGLKFINVSCYAPFKYKNQITGTAATPWNRGIVFDNVTFNHDNGQPPVLLTKDNLNTYFTTNEFAKDLWFRMPGYFKVTVNVNPIEGVVTKKTDDHIKVSVDTTYIEKSTVSLEATAKLGYEFSSWSGDTIATSNPLLLKMNGNKTITANFNAVGTKTVTPTPPINGTISVNPAGASHTTNSTVTLTAKPAIGYKFDSWSGDFTGNNIITTLKMDANKTGSAHFVKTNNFAVNYGGEQYVDAYGTVYAQSLEGYKGSNAISGTSDQPLYQSEKFGKTFSLNYPVENGDYTITLKFAETYHTGAGRRVFNASIEGTPVLTNFDIFADAGKNVALDKTYQVTVADGVVNIGFTTIADNAKICAVKVSKDIKTSIKEANFDLGISIYPNPATDKLFYSSTDKQINKIELSDLTGKVVHSTIVQSQSGSVDLSHIGAGVYLVKICTVDHIYTSKLIIK